MTRKRPLCYRCSNPVERDSPSEVLCSYCYHLMDKDD